MGVLFWTIIGLILLGLGANWDAGNGPIIVIGLLFIGALFVPGSMLTLAAIQERKRREPDVPAMGGDNVMLIGGLVILAADAAIAWLVFGVLT
jgi:hypothetical protein